MLSRLAAVRSRVIPSILASAFAPMPAAIRDARGTGGVTGVIVEPGAALVQPIGHRSVWPEATIAGYLELDDTWLEPSRAMIDAFGMPVAKDGGAGSHCGRRFTSELPERSIGAGFPPPHRRAVHIERIVGC